MGTLQELRQKAQEDPVTLKELRQKEQGDPVKKPTQQVTLQESLQESLQASKCQEPFKVGKIDHSRPIPSGQGQQGQSTLRQILYQKHFQEQEKMLIRTKRERVFAVQFGR